MAAFFSLVWHKTAQNRNRALVVDHDLCEPGLHKGDRRPNDSLWTSNLPIGMRGTADEA